MFARLVFFSAALSLVASACGPQPVTRTTCGAGTHVNGTVCDPDTTDAGQPVTCGVGTHAVGDACIANEVMYGDGGLTDPSTWQTNVRVTPADVRSASEPQMAVDSHGNIFVASMVAGSAPGWSVHLYRSGDVGRTFVEVTAFQSSSRSEFLGDVTVAVDGSDRVFFGWIDYHYDASGGMTSELMVSRSVDGMQFDAPQQVSTQDADNAFNDRPWLSLAPDGSMYISWTAGASEQSGVGARYAQSTDGQPFAAAQTIFDPFPGENELEESPLAFDAHGSPVAISTIYQVDNTTGQLSYGVNTWRVDTGVWASAPLASLVSEPRFTFETYAELTSDSHGVVTAVFLNGISRIIGLYVTRSTDGGQTWSPPVHVHDPRAPASMVTLPWITRDEADRVHLMWLDNRYGNWVPYTAYSSDGTVFSAPERIGDAQFVEDGSSRRWIGDFVSLVIRAGIRYAVWSDTRSGVAQVYFSAAPAP